MVLVLVVLGIFLFSVRTALIVAVTIPFALLFSFICLDWAHIPANLLSIGAIDFGMIVDGAVVMVENIFRELAERHGEEIQPRRRHPRGRARCRAPDLLRDRRHHRGVPADLCADRPVGPAVPADGRHDGVRAARLAALLAHAAPGALRDLPAQARQGAEVPFYDRMRDALRARCSTCACATAPRRLAVCLGLFAASLLLIPFIGAEFMPHLDEGSLWIRATMPYTISFDEASKLGPQLRDLLLELPPGDDRRERARAARRWDRSDWVLQRRVLRRPQAVRRSRLERRHSHEGRSSSTRSSEKLEAFPGIIFNYTQPAEDAVDEARNRPEELAGREDLRVRSRDARDQGRSRPQRHRRRSRHRATSRSCASSGSRASRSSPTARRSRSYGLNVADINTLIETAVGGSAGDAR